MTSKKRDKALEDFQKHIDQLDEKINEPFNDGRNLLDFLKIMLEIKGIKYLECIRDWRIHDQDETRTIVLRNKKGTKISIIDYYLKYADESWLHIYSSKSALVEGLKRKTVLPELEIPKLQLRFFTVEKAIKYIVSDEFEAL